MGSDKLGLLGLGDKVGSSMKKFTHCRPAVKKEKMLYSERIENKIYSIILPLYKSVMWPHLEYCVHLQSHFNMDIVVQGKSEKVGNENGNGKEDSSL